MGERGQLTMTEYTRQTTIHYHTPQAPHAYSISKYLFSYFRYFRIFVSYGPFSGKRFRPEKENRVCLNTMCATSV